MAPRPPARYQARARRHALALACELRIEDGARTPGRVINLSTSGALVLTSELPSADQAVRIALREPLWQIAIDAAGVVARVIDGRRFDDSGRGVGVWLRGLSGWHRYLVAQLLHQEPVAWPTLRERRPLTD